MKLKEQLKQQRYEEDRLKYANKRPLIGIRYYRRYPGGKKFSIHWHLPNFRLLKDHEMIIGIDGDGNEIPCIYIRVADLLYPIEEPEHWDKFQMNNLN